MVPDSKSIHRKWGLSKITADLKWFATLLRHLTGVWRHDPGRASCGASCHLPESARQNFRPGLKDVLHLVRGRNQPDNAAQIHHEHLILLPRGSFLISCDDEHLGSQCDSIQPANRF